MEVCNLEIMNQQLIKNTNIKLLYNTIQENSGISRAQLAKYTHLSKTTISTLVDELVSRKFIFDSGTTETTSVGRKPNSLQVNPGAYYVVVISWIESYVNVYLIDIVGATTYEEHHKLCEDDTYITLSRHCVDTTILSLVSKEKIIGICFVVSAMIDSDSDEIYSTTVSLPKSGGSNLIANLRSAFNDYKVALLSDTPCSAYAEKVYAHVSTQNFVFINFDRGIGATLFIGGKMIGKADGATTQFGHYSIDPNGPICSCGNRGCLETVWGEPALQKKMKFYKKSAALSRLSNITFADLGNAALYGDAVAQDIIKEMATSFSFALSNLISTVNPHLIILGGKSTHLGDTFLLEIKKNLAKSGFQKMIDHVEIKYSKLQSNASLNGAMKYFFDFYFNFTDDVNHSFYIG